MRQRRQLIWEILFYAKVSKVNYIQNFFQSYRMSYFINVIFMPSSFFVICFMDNNPMIVNYKLCLYRCFFFLPEQNIFFLFLSMDRGILCSVVSIKARKPEKYCSTSSEVFSLFVMPYIFCGIGSHFINSFSIFCISLQMLFCSNLNKKPARVQVMQR